MWSQTQRLFTVAVLLACAPLLSAGTIYVPDGQPTIQAGINAAVNGDTVIVRDGTYTGIGHHAIDFGGKAITVMSENGAGATNAFDLSILRVNAGRRRTVP